MDRRLMLESVAASFAAWNRHDADGVVAIAVEDLLWRDVALPMPVQSREELKALLQSYMNAFPDTHLEITSETVYDERLAFEWTATGTHRGPLMGISPTGRATKVYGVTVVVFDDEGRVIEGSSYWNPLAMMHQLGVTPVPEVATAG
jgi:steroid delta-isomerase-like uncharacterized protein